MKTQITKKLFTLIVPMAIVMMFSASSNAQIVYSDVIPDETAFCSTSSCSDTITVDLNKDGNLDFILTFNRTYLGSCPGQGRGGFSPPKYAIKWGVSTTDGNSFYGISSSNPSALNYGNSIDSNLIWSNGADTLKQYIRPTCTTYNISGNWNVTGDRYLPVKISIGGSNYFGWIRLEISTNYTLILKDYAYDSIPNQPIIAGQTIDNFIMTSASKVSQLCAGDSFNVGYLVSGNFDPANDMSVEFSDAAGSFSAGTIVGSATSNVSGTIPCAIPLSFSGAGYRFRVISSNPAQISKDNGTNLIISNGLPDTLVTPTQKQFVCSGSYVALTAPLGNGNSYQWKKDGVNLTGSGSTARSYSANTSGLFSCDISNACGTVQSNVVSLTVTSLPAINILPGTDLTINSGDSIVLKSTVVDPALLYRWYRNSVILNPLVSAMTYTAKISGTYTLKIIEQVHGCSKTSSGVILNVLNLSAVPETYSVQSYLKIHPNPFNNTVFISFSIQDRQKFSVRIVDLAGRLVKTIASDVSGGDNFEYYWMADDQNGNFMNAGIYFLKLEAKGYCRTEKLILIR